MNLAQKGFLIRRKLAFIRTPVAKRVRLELATDGRQITYLLVSLHALGYAVHVVGSPMVFRDLLRLRRSTPIPFIIGGKARDCGMAIADSEAALEEGNEPRKLLLNYDFFNPELSYSRMPYFMHPAVYAEGLHRLPPPAVEVTRTIRIGFFGTRDAEFYTKHFHFPLLNREQILAAFLGEFKDRIWEIDQPLNQWQPREIAVAIDDQGGDRAGKAFLPMADYLAALRQCDFFLSPPGWCMPLSHNLIEGMAAGCIPIINCAEFLDPALEDGVNCLVFHSTMDLHRVIGQALQMPAGKIEELSRGVIAYFTANLIPGLWLRNHLLDGTPAPVILVNAEEISMACASQGGVVKLCTSRNNHYAN